MSVTRRVCCGTLLGLFCAGALTGCFGRTKPAEFYLLEALPDTARLQPAGDDAARRVIVLSPIRIPKYLDRPQIVTATGRNAYRLSEFHRWAEALEDNIGRVLAQNLTLLLPPTPVLLSPPRGSQQTILRLALTLTEFHVDPEGQARLTAQWNLSRTDGTVMSRQLSYRIPASTTDYGVMVQAQNECLNRLSRDLAAALRPLLTDRG